MSRLEIRNGEPAIYTGTCLLCKQEIRAELVISRGEPFPVIGAICDCQPHRPGVTLSYRPAETP